MLDDLLLNRIIETSTVHIFKKVLDEVEQNIVICQRFAVAGGLGKKTDLRDSDKSRYFAQPRPIIQNPNPNPNPESKTVLDSLAWSELVCAGVLFRVFSNFCITSYGDRNLQQDQETTEFFILAASSKRKFVG